MTLGANERVSILFVDRSRGDDVVASLRGRFEVVEAATERAAIRALKQLRPSVVVTGLTLTDGDGLAICREAKALFEALPKLWRKRQRTEMRRRLIAAIDLGLREGECYGCRSST